MCSIGDFLDIFKLFDSSVGGAIPKWIYKREYPSWTKRSKLRGKHNPLQSNDTEKIPSHKKLNQPNQNKNNGNESKKTYSR